MKAVPHATLATRAVPTVVTLLLALMPLLFAVSIRAKAAIPGILMLYGIYLLAFNREARAIYRGARSVAAVFALSLLYAAANIAGHHLRWNEFDLPSHILLFLFISAAFTQPIRIRWFWLALSLTTALLGVVCIYQHHIEGAPRAYGLDGGDWGVIELGMFMLVLALSAVVQLLREGQPRLERIIHGVCAVLGMYGALLTQSRGPLLACVPVFLMVVGLHVMRTKKWRDTLLVLAGAAVIAVVSMVFVRSEILERFHAIGQEVSTYDANDSRGAVRERVEMWRVAGQAFLEHPVTGVGIDQFNKYTQSRVVAGTASDAIAKYQHPHSEYFEAAVAGGVPGLLILLFVFGTPLVFFGRRVLDPDDGVATAATAGLVTVTMYALCGLTDNVFYRAMPHSLFFFLTLGLAVWISRLQREPALRDVASH
jgi:O-antigen ligase